MWCYQKPGFEAQLLAELQRQQQRSQFCDTILQAGGVSVPAHSCILSAVSPRMSSALSSAPMPPAGQSRLLEFQALGACTLLHMVRLLYSGEMSGEGENEKQQAIFAASNLGINGLVEVTQSKSRGGGEEMGTHVEVGVQTQENEVTRSRWRRGVREGVTYLWKETPSGGGKDVWTQTEETNLLPLTLPAASFDTIDLRALQDLGQTDSHQFVPVTVLYPPNENQTIQLSCDAFTYQQVTAGSTSVAPVVPSYPSEPPALPHSSRQTEPQSHWDGPQGGNVPTAEVWEDDQLEQFEGNLAGFLNYFLSQESNQGTRRGRAVRRQRGRPRGGGTRRQSTGRPRGRPPGRGRRTFTQTVDVQEVGVSKQQKLLLDRGSLRAHTMGQGGGAVGRKLFLETRGAFQPARKCRRRRDRSKVLEVSQRGGRNPQQDTPKPFNQFYPGSSSAASVPPAASSSLRTTHFPNTTLSPHEAQSEPMDRLLEEVMIGLDILPNSSKAANNTTSKEKTKAHVTEAPGQQQQCEGELSEILENFLKSFEQHVDSCNTTQQNERDDGSLSEGHMVQSRSSTAQTSSHSSRPRKTRRPVSGSETSEPQCEASSQSLSLLHKVVCSRSASSKSMDKTQEKARTKRKRRTKQYLLSLEKKSVKKSASLTTIEATVVSKLVDHQLQQKPMVRLERRKEMLQEQPCLSQKDKSPFKAKSHVSSGKSSEDISGENLQDYFQTNFYPIRSRVRRGEIRDISAFVDNPLPRRQHSPRQKRLLSSAKDGSTLVQPQPVGSSCTDEQSEKNQRENVDSTTQAQEETPARTGEKRSAGSDGTNEGSPLNKKILLNQMTPETYTPSSEASYFIPAAVALQQVETVSLKSLSLPDKSPPKDSNDKERRSRDDGMTVVKEMEVPESEQEKPLLSHDYGEEWIGKLEEDEDIDVIGGSSPVPNPVVICWTLSSDEEKEDGDEEIDVVGDKMDSPSVIVSNVSKSEPE
ncbi:uncharacterized protein [Nothobranchius furzeri]|uniref:Transcript variant X1 n=1 Tax=Nothobranchius furzeri TaxID=105023 RepID=A0A9D3BZ43_NOTFU|nr:transcript variant X1 [Nothobranchius furzeri]KAF7228263.1 transcript variant X2 [Nothobranchius furzeri]